jgi:hypothetical protein
MKHLKSTRKNSNHPVLDISAESSPVSNDVDKVSRIAVSAYYKAEARGYEPGHEIQDWLAAEAEESL